MEVTLNQIAYVIKALNLNSTQRSILINAFANITGGNIEEMETKIDSLDKEMGDVKNQLDKIDVSTVVLELEIGNSDEVKARNLEKLKKVEHTFLADINYGYGTADWLPATGGQAIITTAAGGQVYYSISSDGAVTKIAENTSQVLLTFHQGTENEISKELMDIILNSKTILIAEDEYPDRIITMNKWELTNSFIGYNLYNAYEYRLNLTKTEPYFPGDTCSFTVTVSNFDAEFSNSAALVSRGGIRNILMQEGLIDNAYILTPKDNSFATTGLLTFDYDTCGAANIDVDGFAINGSKNKLIVWYGNNYNAKIDVTSYSTTDNNIYATAIVTTTNGDNYLNTIIITRDSINCTATKINKKYNIIINTPTDDGVPDISKNKISNDDFDYICANIDNIDIIFTYYDNETQEYNEYNAIYKLYHKQQLYLMVVLNDAVNDTNDIMCTITLAIIFKDDDNKINYNIIPYNINQLSSKSTPGLVKACTNIADVTDSANLMGAFNNLLKQMRAAGMMIS